MIKHKCCSILYSTVMERHFEKLNLFTLLIWLFIATHVLLLFLCYMHAPLTLFYVQNTAGILYFLTLFFLGRLKYISKDTAVFVTVFVLWIQMILSFLAVGIHAGFQVMCFGTLCASFFIVNPTGQKKINRPIIIETGSVCLYLGMIIASHYLEPWYILEESVLKKISFNNTLGTLIELLVFTDVYRMRLSSSVLLLQQQAERDELTGLLNRHGVRNMLDVVSQQWNNNAVPYAVAILDIDDFKQVNDTYGHAAGDLVLKFVAEKLNFFNTGKSAACRWGGEEFMVVGQITFDLGLFFEYLELIRSQIENHVFSVDVDGQQRTFHVTVTCGVAVIDSDMPVHELIDKADHRLYAGKHNGKNQVVVYD